MKFQRILLLLCGLIISSTFGGGALLRAQTVEKTYQQMTEAERTAFVSAQARRIARQMSGTEYEFTPAFETGIQKFVERYVQRIGNGAGDRLWKGDARFVFERGQANAPLLISAFKAQNVSPLIGLYIPLIESEYVNIPTANPAGSIGMFQFLPKTGARFGLTAQDLNDVGKSADAAARYIAQNLKRFEADRMKEALALLAYNRGENAVERDVSLLVNEGNRTCSICALTAQSEKLDETFQKENVYYVPRFFAAAIIGENPQAFGIEMQPLSASEPKR